MERLTEAATLKMDVAFKAEELYKKQLHKKIPFAAGRRLTILIIKIPVEKIN
jgi:hypothetical protein